MLSFNALDEGDLQSIVQERLEAVTRMKSPPQLFWRKAVPDTLMLCEEGGFDYRDMVGVLKPTA